ncbi:RluA family pseudouridine synthase [Candidatus Peregrinibacteria bacterium]|jgi:RluA family pseudouridine synthase|nr:RluA family pseudouridine synthase [Candidatus Peregrinibacteria bacterium]MBT3598570.1 RluA family pseudouridine synthase [Candidatus Peregrinibacteria bacterium]MBT4367401.1 RluA family pseudouridine synthase [Candidatus Peregrinibacteria bacterium]MBT4585281.1 RluA family pseudouridine synthase [Candidatus Peregrinibacteria bacterium]MBT6730565.1 RluA family pseudouridine synthase [Candidatus Peregrinibacteria bacterium]
MPISADRILYEDDHLLIVNKRSGELVVKGKGKVQKLPLLDFLKIDYPSLRPLNRLDFETSGIVVFAKSKEAFENSKKSISTWEKTYKALVSGRVVPKSGEIDRPLPARSSKDLVDASTKYYIVKQFPLFAYVSCKINTGRHHQIRRHFASIKHPLLLDSVYGDEKINKACSKETGFRKFFLHAHKLTMNHPITGDVIKVESDIPKSFEALIGKI